MHHQIMPQDPVRYTGQDGDRLGLSRDRVGEVIAFVQNNRNAMVVDFGGDTYIIGAERLVKHSYRDNIAGPDVEKIVRKWDASSDEKKGKGKGAK
jgi:hypothetical protein